jgi:hypothetical protein
MKPTIQQLIADEPHVQAALCLAALGKAEGAHESNETC